MRIVVIGATSAIAEHCCRLWVARDACDLVLVARDAAKAGRVAEDLRVRSPASTITVVEADFFCPVSPPSGPVIERYAGAPWPGGSFGSA